MSELPTKRLQDELRRAQQGGGCMLPPAELASVLTELIECRTLGAPPLAAQDGPTTNEDIDAALRRGAEIGNMIVGFATPPSQALNAGDGEAVLRVVVGDVAGDTVDINPVGTDEWLNVPIAALTHPAAGRVSVSDAWWPEGPFKFGDRVEKSKGSSWHGRVCGWYTTSLTPLGYNVESEREPGSVQLYPVGALTASLSSLGGGE